MCTGYTVPSPDQVTQRRHPCCKQKYHDTHHKVPESVSRAVLSRMHLHRAHATRRTPRGALKLVARNACLVGENQIRVPEL